MNMMKTGGPLPLTGGTNDQFSIKKVTHTDAALNEVYNLFLRVRGQLCAKGQGHFLLPRTKDSFVRSLKGDSAFLLGAYAPTHNGGEALVGFCVVKLHAGFAEAVAANDITLTDRFGMVEDLCTGKGVAVVQSLCVDADLAAKKGIAQKLLQQAKDETPNCRQVAQTAFANLCGVKSFSCGGYVVVGVGTEVTNMWPTPKMLLLRLTEAESQIFEQAAHLRCLSPNSPPTAGLYDFIYRRLASNAAVAKMERDKNNQGLVASIAYRDRLDLG